MSASVFFAIAKFHKRQKGGFFVRLPTYAYDSWYVSLEPPLNPILHKPRAPR